MVERLVVVQVAVGSSPITHPIKFTSGFSPVMVKLEGHTVGESNLTFKVK